MGESSDNNRRKFLDNGLKLSLATIIGSIGLTKLSASLKSGEKPASGKPVELMTTDGRLIEVDSAEVMDMDAHCGHDPNYNVREGIPNRKFVMVIDLAKCKNALKCVQSCNKFHMVTGDNAWLKIHKMKDSQDGAPYWMPRTCMHCDKPACVTVCPVDATFKRRDGLVLIDNERCIGCRFCMAACPYSIRVFNWSEPEQGDTSEITSVLDNGYPSPDYAGMPSKMGTPDKCDFCPHAIKENVLPHCVTACPNGVFYFGDKYEDTVTNGEETLRFKQLLEDKAGYRLLEELGTEPSVYYLPPVDRLVDFEDGMENYNEFMSVEKPE